MRGGKAKAEEKKQVSQRREKKQKAPLASPFHFAAFLSPFDYHINAHGKGERGRERERGEGG